MSKDERRIPKYSTLFHRHLSLFSLSFSLQSFYLQFLECWVVSIMADTTDVNVEEIYVLDFKDEGRLLRTPAVASWSLNFGTFGLRKTLLVLPQQAWTQPMVTLPLEFEGYDLTCKKVYDALMDILEYVNEHEGHTHGSGQERPFPLYACQVSAILHL